MPELPDVEAFRRYADATALHRPIEDVTLRSRLVEGVTAQTVRRHLRGAKLTGTRRHGKHLFLRCSSQGWLRLHFGMTGYLQAWEVGDEPEHTELRLDLAGGRHLAYVNQRKLGAISWTNDVDAFVANSGLGPDPLADGLHAADLDELLEGRRGTIKGALMDQSLLAGLGNVYVDEILFHAGIDPRSKARDLEEIDSLDRAMREVIETAIEHQADPARLPSDWLLPHRQPDAPCPRCAGTITRIQVVGRATYLCPNHQQRLG